MVAAVTRTPFDRFGKQMVRDALEGRCSVETDAEVPAERVKVLIDGRWFGIVSWTVCDAYGAVVVRHEGGLVPAAALSVREMEPYR